MARDLAHGGDLSAARAGSAYASASLSAFRFIGDYSERTFAAALSSNFCAALSDSPGDVGAFGGPAGTWLVVAHSVGRATRPAADAGRRAGTGLVTWAPRQQVAFDPSQFEQELLDGINAARSQGRACGRKAFPPVPPLQYVPTLERVAAAHSDDMAVHGEFDHRGHDGTTPAQRVKGKGLAVRLVGENIAYGAMTAAEAVDGWLASPSHCENIMDPRFTETGIAVASERGRGGIYFTEVFVQPAAMQSGTGR